MRPEDALRYVQRPWLEIEAAKREHWARAIARSPEATFRASQALWIYMRGVRPDWPTQADRAQDLADHAAWTELLSRAARGLASR